MEVENFLVELTIIEKITFIVLFSTFIVQAVYYLFFFGKVARYKPDKENTNVSEEPVSIVICARNESANLEKNLPEILEQEYPNFEVIVVNDCSNDDSQKLLEGFQEKYTHLHVTQIKEDEKFTHGKKLALTIGIKAAKNEWLLLTDADCIPASRKWLAIMQKNFTSKNDIVLGYGGFISEKGFLNHFIRFDCFFIALQYLGFALNKIPYMGVGRNLAYRKSVFLKNKGFASHSHILSGDDDLFINQVANGKNTLVEISKDAHTRSVPKNTFNQWLIQKRRHFSSSYKYKFKHKLLIGTEVFTRLVFYISAILLMSSPNKYLILLAIAIFLIRAILQYSIFGTAMKLLNEKKILLFSVFFDIIIPLLNIFLYTLNLINSKQDKWK